MESSTYRYMIHCRSDGSIFPAEFHIRVCNPCSAFIAKAEFPPFKPTWSIFCASINYFRVCQGAHNDSTLHPGWPHTWCVRTKILRVRCAVLRIGSSHCIRVGYEIPGWLRMFSGLVTNRFRVCSRSLFPDCHISGLATKLFVCA